jgi:drug/metabolite transporter (DMT)-like permease
MPEKNLWLVYVALAGLSWGTYVPIIFYGGSELGGKPNARLMAILCVGVAYFVIGVLFPLFLFMTGRYPWPDLKMTGLVFSGLAGVAGAVGAIGVIFATQSARAAAPPENPDAFRVFIAPLIFGLAPVINVLVSAVWHPRPGQPFHFALDLPGWKLWVGIGLVSIGAALVLFAKEETESSKHKAAKKQAPAVAAAPAGVNPQEAPQ